MLYAGPFSFAHNYKFNLSSRRKRKRNSQPDCNRQYIKRPPNAFMIYRREQRPHVVAETNITDCAAVNKILGQRVSKSTQNHYCFVGTPAASDMGLTMLFFSTVENDDQERAGKVLWGGQKRKSDTRTAISRLVCQRQLCTYSSDTFAWTINKTSVLFLIYFLINM